MSEIITRAASVKPGSVNLEDRTADFVISSEAVDSYRTVFLSDRWDFSRYERNPVVAYNHRTHDGDPDFIIGTSEIYREGTQILARVTFEPAEDNTLAEKILRKVSRGILRGASIGADVDGAEWGDKNKGQDPEVLYFTGQRLLEWSIVNIPSNPDALVRTREAIDRIKSGLKPPTEKKDPKALSRCAAQLIINKNRSKK